MNRAETIQIETVRTGIVNGPNPVRSIPSASTDRREAIPFGTLVRQLRLRNGLTQKELATQTGYGTPEWTCMLERGERQINLEDVPQIARILTVDAYDLVLSFIN